VACTLFAKNFFTTNAGSELIHLATSFAALVDDLYDSVHFTQLLCDFGSDRVSPNGTGIPFTMGLDDDRCGAEGKAKSIQHHDSKEQQLKKLKASGDDAVKGGEKDGDNMYQFNEEHHAVHLAYQQACGHQAPGECDNEAIELMWNRWQGRRLHPTVSYKGNKGFKGNQGFNVSSTWASYVAQLVYYTSQSFNSDPDWMNLFVQGWEADRLFYKQHYYQGMRGRYGLGEGPEEEWCSESASGYAATNLVAVDGTLTPGKRKGIRKGARKHCLMYSANVVAAWLPARSGLVKHQLLELLEDGETVVPVAGTDLAVLWRSSLLSPSGPSGTQKQGAAARLTLIDLIPELLGIASLWLDDDFFQHCAPCPRRLCPAPLRPRSPHCTLSAACWRVRLRRLEAL